MTFDDYWFMYKREWRKLKVHNLGGIVALLDVPDSEGVYSIGDPVDIIELISVIRQHIYSKLSWSSRKVLIQRYLLKPGNSIDIMMILAH